MANWGNLLRQAVDVGMKLLSESARKKSAPATAPDRPVPHAPARPAGPRAPHRDAPAAGARHDGVRTAPTGDRACVIDYAPDLDGSADPGEIVWAWVPFEEDDSQGKDRPLLVVGRQGEHLVGLMLSSQHSRDGDPDWIGIGTGGWDREGRESFIRLDRVLEVGEHEIRREGAVLDRERFDRVAHELRSRFGWS